MARGDVIYVSFPPPRGGHEQAGRRPAIVVQVDPIATILPTVVVVPLTAKLAALRFPHTIRVEPSALNGLAEPSVILVFQITVVDKTRLLDRLGRLEEPYVAQLNEQLRDLLGVASH